MQKEEKPSQKPKELKVFIPSHLDDYGLRPNVFRLYCHIARRDGPSGAYPAVKTMARVCRIHPQTARDALRYLTEQGFLTREKRPGRTTIYRLTPLSSWPPPETD